jgi:glycosyltransferase involved in cell wall biosynthesis
MKITIVAGPFYPIPPGPAGSVEKIWTRLANEFAKRGHSVTIVSRRFGNLPIRETTQGIQVIRRTQFSRTGSRAGDLFLEMCYAAVLSPTLPSSDVIVTNTIFLPILTGLIPKRVGQTVVSVERFPKGQLKWYSRCSRLRTTSKAVDCAARHQCPSLNGRIKRIPNPVDLRVFYPPVARPDARNGTILYAGRVHPEKGLEILIKAFRIVHRNFSGTQLTVIGPHEVGRGGAGVQYLASLKRIGEGLPITFLANTDTPQVLADYLRSGSVFCYPSIAEQGESFPVAPLEAMATGLPCVLSKLAVFEDLLEEGRTGLFFDHKADHPEDILAAKLEMLIVNDQLRRDTEVRAAAKAAQFGYDTIADEFLKDFEALIGQRGNNTSGRETRS